jgi:hypothetical protein
VSDGWRLGMWLENVYGFRYYREAIAAVMMRWVNMRYAMRHEP